MPRGVFRRRERERVPSGDERTRESSQQTGTAASQATLQETLSWISQNFRSVVEDDDFLLNQRKLGFDGCDIELRKALHHKKKGGGITFGDATSSTVTVDLGSLYYPELGNTRHTTPQGGAAAALKFRTKNMQPLLHREIDVTEGGLEGVRRRMQEFRRTGNAKSAHDWSEEQETDRFTLYFERTMAARHHKAFTRAIKLCGGEPPPF